MKDVKRICVYCASSTKIDSCYVRDAERLGGLMAARGIALVNGAGNMGLMRASADGCMRAGGEAIGVIPTFMIREGWCHEGMTRIIETADMHERQAMMARMGDAAIALPGGCGTLAELTELITWKQLGLYVRPIVLLNTGGYYDPMLHMLEQAVEQHFMRPEHAAIWKVADTPEKALGLAIDTPDWNTGIRRFAAI